MQYKQNKNGVKLLAAVAVFAMIFACTAVITESDAEVTIPESVYTGQVEIIDKDGTTTTKATDLSDDVLKKLVDGDTLRLVSNITTNKSLKFSTENITIDGNGCTITATKSTAFTGEYISGAKGEIYVLNITNAMTVKNLTVDSAKFAFGINVSASVEKEIVLDNITSDNSCGAGFVFGNATIKATKLSADNFGWGAGINYDKSAEVTIDTLDNVHGAYKDSNEAVGEITVEDDKDGKYVKYLDSNGNVISYLTADNESMNNTNAFSGGAVKDSAGTWELSEGRLTLNNYDGAMYFDGSFSEVILVGENTITLENCANALKSSGDLTIKSVNGVGSLNIVMNVNDSKENVDAISANGLSINGVDISITITEDYETAPESEQDYRFVYAINAGTFDMYDGSLIIDVANENVYRAIGIYTTGKVDIKSSEITINAGSRGINSDSNGGITIAASQVTIEADQLGIRATTGNAKVSITNESVVDATVYGLAEGYGKSYGMSVSGSIEVQSDSVLTTDGMIIYGNNSATPSVNNATINNNGDMVIWNTAAFDNKGKLNNNGTIGVYGAFTNSAGETVNNGMINTYNQWRGEFANKFISIKDGEKIATFTLDKMMPLADGSFMVEITDNATESNTYVGTMKFTFDGTKVIGYALSATSANATVTVDCDSTSTTMKYSVYSSVFEISGTVGDSTSTVQVKTDSIKDTCVANADKGKLSVTGGKLTNASQMSLDKIEISNGEFANNGELTVSKEVNITGGKIAGNDITIVKDATVQVKGDADIAFTYSGKYKDSDKDVEFTDSVRVSGKVDVKFKAIDKGVIEISKVEKVNAPATITIESGKATNTNDLAIGGNMTLSILSGATLDIKGKATSTAGVIAIQDGATINMKTTDRNTFSFGVLDYQISFANSGYTYYGSLQFALANAAEGATLTLNGNADIDVDTVVKKNITLQFGEKATLNVIGTADKKTTLSMEEGASFILNKDAVLNIGANSVVSGTITYDGNGIILDKVEISNEATVKSVASTKNTASEISVDATVEAGNIIANAGIVSGKVTLGTATGTDGKVVSVGGLIVSKDATSKIVLTDCKESTTKVDGTMKVDAALTIKGKIVGDGKIVLKDNTAITLEKDSVVSIDIENADGSSKVTLDNVRATKDGKDESTITVTSVPKTGNKEAYIALSKSIYSGTVTATGIIGLNGLTVNEGATIVVPSGATLNVITDSTAKGLVKVAGTINLKVENDTTTSSYGKLDYQITYEDADYTVYTYLSTGVNNAKPGDSFTIDKDLTIETTMTVPAGVTIDIADDVTLTVADGQYITVGTAATTIGATTGISGKIVLDGKAFVIVYNDSTVDMSKANIVTGTGTSEAKAKNSQFTVLNELYATVYVGTTDNSKVIAETVAPEITGYRFVEWMTVNDKVLGNNDVGNIDFYAKMTASKVQIIFKHVDGIKYYIDNVRVNSENAPVYVNFGAIVTAVADYGYTGTALVNGKEFISIDSTTTTIVGSGVTAASSDSSSNSSDNGMGITDYLLIVLVVLAAILVVIVALRMMRS